MNQVKLMTIDSVTHDLSEYADVEVAEFTGAGVGAAIASALAGETGMPEVPHELKAWVLHPGGSCAAFIFHCPDGENELVSGLAILL